MTGAPAADVPNEIRDYWATVALLILEHLESTNASQ